MRFRKQILFAIGLVTVSAILALAPSLLVKIYSFDRWDNHEYFSAMLKEIHMTWLRGRIPAVNFHQHLGEPLPSNASSGPFYPLYTLGVFFVYCLHLSWTSIPWMVTLLHLPLGLAGNYILLRSLNVRRSLAAAGAVSVLTCGYICLYAPVWLNCFPNFCLLPWAVFFSLQLVQGRLLRTSTAGLAIVLSLLAALHPQMMIYSWLYIGIVTLSLGFVHRISMAKWKLIFAVFAVAALLSSLPSLTTYMYSMQTVRSDKLALTYFLEGSIEPLGLLGVFTPLASLPVGYLIDKSSLPFFQGMQLPCSLLFFGLLIFVRHQKPDEQRNLDRKTASCLFFPALIFVLFSLGKHFYPYVWSYQIPVWSSFRWPFKFLLLAMFGLGSAAVVYADIAISQLQSHRHIAVAVSVINLVVAFALTFFLRVDTLFTAPALLAIVSGLGILLVFPWLDQKRIRMIFFILTLASSVSVIALAQDFPLNAYPDDQAPVGTKELAIDSEYRVLPVITVDLHSRNMQEMTLYNSATLNDYYSLTGETHLFIASKFTSLLPSNILGLLYPSVLRQLIPSPLMRSLGVRYLVADKEDAGAKFMIESSGSFQPVHETKIATIYENRSAKKLVFFADEIWPQNSNRGDILFDPQSDPKASKVLVEMENLKEKVEFSKGVIASPISIMSDGVDLEVANDKEGFLVFSFLNLPGWHAYVDNIEVEIHQVNRILMGIVLPAHAKMIHLNYEIPGFRFGLLLTSVGLIAMIVLLWQLTREKQNYESNS